jgi:hypothetical protein
MTPAKVTAWEKIRELASQWKWLEVDAVGGARGDHRNPAPNQIDGRRRQLVVMPLRPTPMFSLSAKPVLFGPSPKDNGAMEAWEPGKPSLRKAMHAGKCRA